MARTENAAHFLLILSKAMVSAAIVFVQHGRKSKLSAFHRGDQLHFTSEGLNCRMRLGSTILTSDSPVKKVVMRK
jgi:hypothetical protein